MRNEDIKKQVSALCDDGIELLGKLVHDKGKTDVSFEYQAFYTSALSVIRSLAPDRLADFKSFYEPDPRRKSLGYGTYVLQDFFRGVVPAIPSNFDSLDQAARAIYNQLSILKSVLGRVDSSLANIEGALIAEFQDAELNTARDLLKVSPRAAGALAGVMLEAHLQKVATARGIVIRKKHPTIADLNDPLKQAAAYDTPAWRKVSYLGDIRNLCTHKKASEPTVDQVSELIDGVNWAVKTIH